MGDINFRDNEFRRHSDKILFDTFVDVKDDVAEIKSDIKLLLNTVNQLNGTVKAHQEVLYGSPKDAVRGGLISEVSNLKGDIKNIKSVFAIIYGAVITGINFIFNWLTLRKHG